MKTGLTYQRRKSLLLLGRKVPFLVCVSGRVPLDSLVHLYYTKHTEVTVLEDIVRDHWLAHFIQRLVTVHKVEVRAAVLLKKVSSAFFKVVYPIGIRVGGEVTQLLEGYYFKLFNWRQRRNQFVNTTRDLEPGKRGSGKN